MTNTTRTQRPAPACPRWCDDHHAPTLGPIQVWQAHQRTVYTGGDADELGLPSVTVTIDWMQRVDGQPDTDTPHVSVCLYTDDETAVTELSPAEAGHLAAVMRATGGPHGAMAPEFGEALAEAARILDKEENQ